MERSVAFRNSASPSKPESSVSTKLPSPAVLCYSLEIKRTPDSDIYFHRRWALHNECSTGVV